MMEIKGNQIDYKWIPNWTNSNVVSTDMHSHNDLAIDSEGNFYVSFAQEPYLRVFNPAGEQLRSYDVLGPEIHSLAISKDDEGEWLWMIDLSKQKLHKCSMDAEVLKTLSKVDFNIEKDAPFNITALAIDPANGNVWVADGYGGNVIYCFDKNFKLLFSFDGSESVCGNLSQPHWIFADTRKGYTEIYIADRMNHRILIYSATGEFLREIAKGLNTPSGFSSFDDKLVVAELKARLHILDADDNIIETYCDGTEYVELEGWPNRKSESAVCPIPVIDEGKFNSPHGMIADADGNIYVTEWLYGIRLTKLEKQ
ncbi:MAG: hypothetical protein MK193_04265 [Lentisphaeria bacterium]|nr:hypothetical protein [Lentisphaeria bacterium]